MRKFIGFFAGVCLLLVGALTFPLPLPIGLPLALAGAALILATNRAAVRRVRTWRRNHPGMNAKLTSLSQTLPQPLRRTLDRTKARIKGPKKPTGAASQSSPDP